jgi:hypothetical protein
MPRCEFNHTDNIYRCVLILFFAFACQHTYAQSTQSQGDTSGVPVQTTDGEFGGADLNGKSDSEISVQEAQQSAAGETGASMENSSDVFDIEMLVERMKETDAIGVISKLSLKNKVDDLLEQAEEIKDDEPGLDKSEQTRVLREKFEGLILKTVALLNKGEDFTLAQDIYLAREELWKSIMENKA